MKEYHSISREIRYGEKIYAFDKLDGQGFRTEWNKKNKFCKFGSRTQMVGKDDPQFGEAVNLVLCKYEKNLHDLFVKNRFEKVICFFEYWGKNSFAGRHVNEEHYVTLFDVSVHKKGILEPNEYIKMFGHLDIAKLLYYGNANHELEEQVRNRQLSKMTFEGVVCKGRIVTHGMPLMFKIKSLDWLNKLKDYCNGDESMFEKLV